MEFYSRPCVNWIYLFMWHFSCVHNPSNPMRVVACRRLIFRALAGYAIACTMCVLWAMQCDRSRFGPQTEIWRVEVTEPFSRHHHMRSFSKKILYGSSDMVAISSNVPVCLANGKFGIEWIMILIINEVIYDRHHVGTNESIDEFDRPNDDYTGNQQNIGRTGSFVFFLFCFISSHMTHDHIDGNCRRQLTTLYVTDSAALDWNRMP